MRRPDNGAGGYRRRGIRVVKWAQQQRRPCDAHTRATSLAARNLPFTAGRLAGMDDLLDALHALRPLWLPSLVLSLAAGAGLALIAWS
jgi:hypothetical protein